MNTALKTQRKYYGKYAATVTAINPTQPWRLQLQVADVLGYIPSTWAEPCLPLTGAPGLTAASYFIPPMGAGVWVEFEQGDPSRPIWVGCRISSSADVPTSAISAPPATPPVILQSITQNKLILSSLPGEGITIETVAGPLGPQIVLNATGIKLSFGPASSIEVTPVAVKINGTALVVSAAV